MPEGGVKFKELNFKPEIVTGFAPDIAKKGQKNIPEE